MDIKEVYMEKKQLWKKQNYIHICYWWLLQFFFREIVFTEKSKKKEKERKSRTKKTTTNTWSHLLKTCLNKMMIMAKISLMSKTMRKIEDMFKTCRICTTMKIHSEKAKFQSHSRISGYIQSKLLLYCYRYTTILLLQLHHNIITILWIVKKKVFFNHFVTVFLPLKYLWI